ncbi:hypothetical protein [Gemmatimonas sp.]|jgi:CubicO group peptidase (beta-lactamase class C family)|uniref:hypothetical protein n=1 Tax=Gemmatimonas sp. TaxID=1962908 RepID=UPI0037C0CFA5
MMRLRTCCHAPFVLLASIGWAAADSTPRPAPPTTIAELEARSRRVLDTTRTPGVGPVIVRRDSVIYANGPGNARVAPARPAMAATLFRPMSEALRSNLRERSDQPAS